MIWIAFSMPWSRSSISKGAKLESRNFSNPSGGAMRGSNSSWTGPDSQHGYGESFLYQDDQ